MPSVSEDQLTAMTRPAFGNEEELAVNTERIIRGAVLAHPLLAALPVKVYAKGSYRNNTNVRRDSDVDVAVEYTGINFPTYGESADAAQIDRALGLTPYDGPLVDATGSTNMSLFKDAVGEALTVALGADTVTRHNKVFTVRESRRSLAADVIPCATHVHYWSASSSATGIRLLPDRPTWQRLHNYPQQHYARGVAKNDCTQRRYKRVVRILKTLENRMVADGVSPAVPGYLVECLVYGAPERCFTADPWGARVREVLAYIWTDTESPDCESRWLEVNEVKLLFHPAQKWTRGSARDFVLAAWQYLEGS